MQEKIQNNKLSLMEGITVHSPIFFRKIIEIERLALRATILHECQNYLGGGGGLGSKRSHEKIGDCEQSTVKKILS